ncbi:hypothetical protein SISNIDRAFT_234562 [Sistotremastrum niveocremeum HHB9708]|uniref:Uncharacterized protein n=1 Tax=Sistotremastrum niveocremeum HHB9708 TaxID=1314777 RepID=A0A164PVC9_9AGAM|nr:hypothetical protein SISNIDRAFT_234562 [Sistotremastrum niveocremeum HHB9708]
MTTASPVKQPLNKQSQDGPLNVLGLECEHREETGMIETVRVGEQDAGPDLGAPNDEIRRGRLQMTSDENDVLHKRGIFG